MEEFDSNVIIDCDILEAAKENIQPLASGRRVTALASVLATPAASRDARLEATRARMRERVAEARDAVERAAAKEKEREDKGEDEDAEDEGDDEDFTLEEASELLLDAYVRFVTWTIEHYPKGQSASSGILELLEEATRVLRHSEHARQDARYLNLWVRYAGYVEKPELIYGFLLANEIGTGWARVYEEYAGVLERGGRRTKADEIYVLGINRRAEPFDHLERRHREFQKRMMVAAAIPSDSTSPAAAALPQSTSSAGAPPRRVLGDATPATAPRPPAPSQDDVFTVPSTSRLTLASSAQSQSRPNGRMPVFVDQEGIAAEPTTGNAWPGLGTRSERVKENVRARENMSGTVLKQKSAAKAATKSAADRARAGTKIVPFRDGDEGSAEAGPSKAVATRATSTTAFAANGKTKLVPFKDSGTVKKPTGTSAGATKAKAKIVPFTDSGTPAAKPNGTGVKSKVQIFRDTDPSAAPAKSLVDCDEENDDAGPGPEDTIPKVPKAPLFVPFRDDDVDETPAATAASTNSSLRPKMLGEKDLASGTCAGVKASASSEVEALRKDPFKNYQADEL